MAETIRLIFLLEVVELRNASGPEVVPEASKALLEFAEEFFNRKSVCVQCNDEIGRILFGAYKDSPLGASIIFVLYEDKAELLVKLCSPEKIQIHMAHGPFSPVKVHDLGLEMTFLRIKQVVQFDGCSLLTGAAAGFPECRDWLAVSDDIPLCFGDDGNPIASI